jgi:hypothetical protein
MSNFNFISIICIVVIWLIISFKTSKITLKTCLLHCDPQSFYGLFFVYYLCLCFSSFFLPLRPILSSSLHLRVGDLLRTSSPLIHHSTFWLPFSNSLARQGRDMYWVFCVVLLFVLLWVNWARELEGEIYYSRWVPPICIRRLKVMWEVCMNSDITVGYKTILMTNVLTILYSLFIIYYYFDCFLLRIAESVSAWRFWRLSGYWKYSFPLVFACLSMSKNQVANE